MRKETDGVLDKIRVHGKPRHYSIIITGHDKQLTLLFNYLVPITFFYFLIFWKCERRSTTTKRNERIGK